MVISHSLLLTEGKAGLKEWWTCIHFLCETQVFKCMTFSITQNWAHPHVVQFNGIHSCCPAPDLRVVLPLCTAIRSESWMRFPCDYLKLTSGSLTNSGGKPEILILALASLKWIFLWSYSGFVFPWILMTVTAILLARSLSRALLNFLKAQIILPQLFCTKSLWKDKDPKIQSCFLSKCPASCSDSYGCQTHADSPDTNRLSTEYPVKMHSSQLFCY